MVTRCVLERLRLHRHVFGQRIQGLEPFLGRRRELVHRPERCDLRLEILDRAGGGCGAVQRVFRGLADGCLIVGYRRHLAPKLTELAFDAGHLVDGAAHVGVRPLQLDVRIGHQLTLSSQRFDRSASLPVFVFELLHGLAVLLELSARVRHERGRFLGQPHDVGHLSNLRLERLEACNVLVEIPHPRDDCRQLIGRVNRPVSHVLDRRRDLGEPAVAAVEAFEHRSERLPFVASGDNDLVQFVGTLLCLGAERQLLEHVFLQSPPGGPTRVRDRVFGQKWQGPAPPQVQSKCRPYMATDPRTAGQHL